MQVDTGILDVDKNINIKNSRRAWVLIPGTFWNPLMNYPRNNPCPCGSKKKFKKCHLNIMPRTVKKEEHDKWVTWLKQQKNEGKL